MKTMAVQSLMVLWLAAVPGTAQTAGLISGIVTGPDGTAIASAPVQARNVKTLAAYQALASSKGQYTLSGVPGGTYEISVTMPGFAYLPFVRPGVELLPGARLSVNIRLADGNLSTLGDDPFTYNANLREQALKLTGRAPRTRWGTPDLSGIWNGKNDLFPENVELLPWAE
jgi:hypothetical protein